MTHFKPLFRRLFLLSTDHNWFAFSLHQLFRQVHSSPAYRSPNKLDTNLLNKLSCNQISINDHSLWAPYFQGWARLHPQCVCYILVVFFFQGFFLFSCFLFLLEHCCQKQPHYMFFLEPVKNYLKAVSFWSTLFLLLLFWDVLFCLSF